VRDNTYVVKLILTFAWPYHLVECPCGLFNSDAMNVVFAHAMASGYVLAEHVDTCKS